MLSVRGKLGVIIIFNIILCYRCLLTQYYIVLKMHCSRLSQNCSTKKYKYDILLGKHAIEKMTVKSCLV